MAVSVVAFLLAAASVAVACGLVLRWPPVWQKELKKSWLKTNLFAGGLALLEIALVCYFMRDAVLLEAIAAAISGGVLTFIFGQALVTDSSLRLVDGRLQYLGALLAGGVNFFVLQKTPMGGVIVSAMVIFVLLALAGRFLVPERFLGAADWRAFMTLATTILPVAGLAGLVHSLYGFFFLALGFSAITTFLRRRKESVKANPVGYLTTKVSIPAVPLMLGPAVILLPLYLSPWF